MYRLALILFVLAPASAACGGGSTAEHFDGSGASPSAADAGSDDLQLRAAQWLAGQDVPESGIPPGFLAVSRIEGECVGSFGIGILEPEAAYASGVYYFETGDQPERVDAIQRACAAALRESGVLLDADEDAFRLMYEAFTEVHKCLQENGYPTTEPPTVETFLDHPSGWTPWVGMIGNAAPILRINPPSTGPLADYFESLVVCPRP